MEDREREIHRLTTSVDRSKHDGTSQAYKLSEDKEKLRVRISEIEIDSHHALENLKSALDSATADQLDSLKLLHDTELEVMTGELHKLRGLLEVKTREIEALIDQNKGQKRNFDEETHSLRTEMLRLRERIAENNDFANGEISSLVNSLHGQHETDIQGLKFHHENAITAMAAENAELKRIIDAKQCEIDNQLREKQIIRENLTDELERLAADINDWKAKCEQTETYRQTENAEAQRKYNDLNAQ